MVATGGSGPGALATLPAVTRRLIPLLLTGVLAAAAGCADHDGREMVANGIGVTPESTTTTAPPTTSSLPR